MATLPIRVITDCSPGMEARIRNTPPKVPIEAFYPVGGVNHRMYAVIQSLNR